MSVSAKTVISFGLVAIPVALYTATQSNDINFNQLHKDDGSRIKYKKVCAHCGNEVSASDIVKGYQYDKDHFVVVTDDEDVYKRQPTRGAGSNGSKRRRRPTGSARSQG